MVLAISHSLDWLIPLFIPKYVDGISLIKACLWFAAIAAANIPVAALFATGRAWLYGNGVFIGFLTFLVCCYWLIPVLGGTFAVVAGSLIGRAVRTFAAYVELGILSRREARLAANP